MRLFANEIKDNRRIINILGIKISYKINYRGSDQWNGDINKNCVDIYRKFIELSIEETIEQYPSYYKRVKPVLDFASGVVLELGCGSGNITKFMNEEDSITKIYAVDLYQMPIDMLIKQNFSKVIPICSNVMDIDFKPQLNTFDTITLNEIIEHLTLKEELITIKK